VTVWFDSHQVILLMGTLFIFKVSKTRHGFTFGLGFWIRVKVYVVV